jgi:Xaa-Pro aminopeptidase
MVTDKLQQLRDKMKEYKVAAFIIPTTDPHKSEYVPDYWKCREWLTGFTGSAGTAVVTANHAGLWTDSRYFIQAYKQLVPPFLLHRMKTRAPEYIEWLLDHLAVGDKVAIDERLFSASEADSLFQTLRIKQITVLPVGELFQGIWQNRPILSSNPVYIHPGEYVGIETTEKIAKVRSYLKEKKGSEFLITVLDEIAWLLNIRGSDVTYNPFVTSYCLINESETLLFINEVQLSENVMVELERSKIKTVPYFKLVEYLRKLPSNSTILLDKNIVNYQLFSSIPSNCKIISEQSIITKLKAIKTPKEIAHYKEAQIRDGIAMCHFLNWLENEVQTRTLTELEAASKSAFFRQQQPNFVDLSFEPISAYQQNAALPHYSPSEVDQSMLEPKGLYLIDSGGQYLGGTTDITRTIALGTVTQEQIVDFTLVLKGHIRLASACFPIGTRGIQLDTLARLDLWQNGKDYGHGTGHGIGYFLGVHEGPHGFSQAGAGASMVPFEPGMLVTNEPGVYHENKYGIRIENVMVCQTIDFGHNNSFLGFETVTYCPIDKKLIDKSMLTKQETDWINSYHSKVLELLEDHVNGEVLDWLIKNTLPI